MGIKAIVGAKLGTLTINKSTCTNPFEKNVLFLFCGNRSDRIKGLLWEGDGFLLLYKRIEDGSFSWPKTPDEAAELTRDQYYLLMKGLNPVNPKIREVSPKRVV